MNKKTLLIAVLTVFMFQFETKAQVKENAIKFNIFGVLANQYQLGYERALNENISVQLSAGYIGGTMDASVNGIEVWDGTRSGIILIPEGRYYFTEGLKGAYGGAFFRYRNAKWTLNDKDDAGFDYSHTSARSSVGGGVVFGYQALVSDALVLDVFIGPQYKSTSVTKEYTNKNQEGFDEKDEPEFTLSGTDNSGVGIRFGFNIGYAF